MSTVIAIRNNGAISFDRDSEDHREYMRGFAEKLRIRRNQSFERFKAETDKTKQLAIYDDMMDQENVLNWTDEQCRFADKATDHAIGFHQSIRDSH